MADRTSAGIFGSIFGLLAVDPTSDHKKLAESIYNMTKFYDFNDCQMEANDACIVLGIARMGISLNYPEGGEVVLFPGDPGYDQTGGITWKYSPTI